MERKVVSGIIMTMLLTGMLTLAFNIHASSTLTITVATSSQHYIIREDIEIFGNLTLNGLPVQALVALQVNNPIDSPIILRTLQTGEDFEVGSFETLSFYSCDALGYPKTTFETGTLAYLKMSVKNTGNTTQYVLVMANTYDSSNSNLGLSAGAFVPVINGTVLTRISSLYIPTSASPGNATAYASALTNWPTQGGVPYCPEMSTQFEIISQQGLGSQSSQAQGSQTSENGTYNLTFKLLTDARLGNYTACVSSTYQGETVTESTTFNLSGPSLAVTSVVPAKNQVYPTWIVPLKISVTVLNKGTEPANFTVATYCNDTLIETPQTVTDLAASTMINLTFSWNLTDVSWGNYTIKANATLEGNADNDEKVDGTVKVKMPGDLDGSAKVDWQDLREVCLAYGSTPAIPDKWNPQCDFDGNGKVDWRDLRTLCLNYGMHAP